MKKISTVAMERIQIFKENQLTIGMDLGDRTSHYCILNEAGEVIWESKLPTTPKGVEEVFGRIPLGSDRAGDGDAFTLDQPTVDPVGSRSDRGPRA